MIVLAKEIWDFALHREIMITAEYLPGILNVKADQASRFFQDSSEWLLSPKIFRQISHKLGYPSIDLFASRACHQIQSYMSWKPDPQSLAVDVFQQNWQTRGLTYAFPPFSLIGKVVRKVRMEKATSILITPHWPAQSWYNQILEICIRNPLLLTSQEDLLLNPQGEIHPLVENKTLNLMAWTISGKDYLQKAYQQKLQTLSSKPDEEALHLIMNRPGVNGFAGVLANRLIPMDVL